MKKILACSLALVIVFAMCVTGCEKKEEADFCTHDEIAAMEPVFGSLIYAYEKYGEYNAANADVVWYVLQQILNNYGYDVHPSFDDIDRSKMVASQAAAIKPPYNDGSGRKYVTVEEAEHLVRACFGKDAVLPELPENSEFFTWDGEVYTAKPSDPQEFNVVISSYTNNEACKLVINLTNSQNEILSTYRCVMDRTKDKSPAYPLFVTMFDKPEGKGSLLSD